MSFRKVRFPPLLSDINDSSIVLTMYNYETEQRFNTMSYSPNIFHDYLWYFSTLTFIQIILWSISVQRYLSAGGRNAASSHFDVVLSIPILLAFSGWIVLWLVSIDPVSHGLANRRDDSFHQVLLMLDRLPQRLPQRQLDKVLQISIDMTLDGFTKDDFHFAHQQLQPFDH